MNFGGERAGGGGPERRSRTRSFKDSHERVLFISFSDNKITYTSVPLRVHVAGVGRVEGGKKRQNKTGTRITVHWRRLFRLKLYFYKFPRVRFIIACSLRAPPPFFTRLVTENFPPGVRVYILMLMEISLNNLAKLTRRRNWRMFWFVRDKLPSRFEPSTALPSTTQGVSIEEWAFVEEEEKKSFIPYCH